MKKLLNKHWLKITTIIFGLTFLFIIDDVLILLLMGELRIWTISASVYFFLSLIVLILNVSLAVVVYRVLKKQPTTGREGMIGKTGVTLEEINSAGKISIKGEIWQAESDEKIEKGVTVVVIKLSGLTVIVKRV